MPAFDPVALGLTLLGAGLFTTCLLLIFLRIFPGWRLEAHSPSELPLTVDIPTHQEAIILVENGGRVGWVSSRAREWFGLGEETPHLELLARVTHPQGVFLGLCATEGQARFLLDGRSVEGTSYRVPYQGAPALLISLRRQQILVDFDESTDSHQPVFSDQTLSIFTELSQAMASSLDLEPTLQTILESIERLIPADFSEIAVWNQDKSRLVRYRLTGIPDSDRQLEKIGARRPGQDGYTAYLVTNRSGLIIPNVESYARIPHDRIARDYSFQSYLGLPLLIAGELIGVIELASLSAEAYNPNDLEVLRILSGQAAVALHNTLLFEEEQRRVLELSGLAKLTQAISSLQEPQELFERLVESLLPLIPVELLGFLIYDEERQRLEGQLPFQGLLPDTIEWTYLSIEPDSEAEEILLSKRLIFAEQAPTDPTLQVFGLDHLALAAGISQLIMMPLSSGGRMLGYLLVGDRLDNASFEENDIRLLSIIAGQAATIIANADLVQTSRRRAQRAETLRRIASLTGSTANLDEILKYSLLDLARLLGAKYAAVFLVDENRGELRLHRGSLFGTEKEINPRASRILLDDPQFRFTVTGSGRSFMSDDLIKDQRVLSLYRTIIETLELRSVIMAPLIIRNRGIGEIMLGHTQPGFFERGDEQTVTTAAGQLAGAIEQESLYNQTDESLRRRVDQLTALTRISRELNTTLELNYLLERVYDEAVHTTAADCGTISLFEIDSGIFDLDFGSSSEIILPEVILRLGDEPTDEMEILDRLVLEKEESLLIEDFEQLRNAVHAASPVLTQAVSPAHEGVRSALIVPIAYQEQIAGIIHLHASQPGRFDQAAREIAEALAVQAAIAIGNAHRYYEQMRQNEMLNHRVETLAQLFETSQGLQLDRPLEESLENIAYGIQSATAFNVVLISVFDPQDNALHRITGAGITLQDMEELRRNPQSWDGVQKVLKPEFRIGRSYFIPYERMPLMPADIHTLTVLPLSDVLPKNGEAGTKQLWHPEDVLVVTLFDADNTPLGMISVDAPRDNQRPDRTMIETLEIFASQAALVIESHNKLSDLRWKVDSMQSEMDRSQQAIQTARQNLPVLLHKDLEQTIKLQNLGRQARRIRAGMDIAEIVNRQGTRDAAIRAFGREFLLHMDVDAVLIAEPGSRGPNLIHHLGKIPEDANLQALLGQRNPLLQCIESGQSEFISHLDSESEWYRSPLLEALSAKGFICLPILDGTRVDVALMGLSQSQLPPFSEEDTQLYGLLSRQLAITLQNLSLLTETSHRLAEVNLLLDFSRQAGSLEPGSILQTLVNSALHVIPQAQACVVLLWNENSHELVPQAAAGYSQIDKIMAISYREGESLPGKVFQDGFGQRIAELDFAAEYSLDAENLLRYSEAMEGQLPISSMILPIASQMSARPLGIIVLENYRSPDAFTAESQALISSLTQQTALNLENTRLYLSSEQRAAQLKSLTDIAAVISSSLEPSELIDSLLKRLQDVLPYDTGTLWLRQGDRLIVRAAHGFSDSEERVGLVAEIEDSLLMKEMLETGKPILVSDLSADPRFPSLLEPQYLSWLGAPLTASGEVIGVIALEKVEANYYRDDHAQIAATFASQAAVALENASLYQQSLARAGELDQRSQRLEILNRLSKEYSESLDPDHLLEFTLHELANTLRCTGAIGIMMDQEMSPWIQTETPSISAEYPIQMPTVPLFDRLHQSLGVYISENAQADESLAGLEQIMLERDAHSILILPQSTGSDLHGLLIAYKENTERFTPDEISLSRTIANQAAIAIQNARLYAESRSLTEDLDRRVRDRTFELANEHRRTETLLRIITELSASLDLEQVLSRTMNVLNEIVNAENITVLIARPEERELTEIAAVMSDQALAQSDGITATEPIRELAQEVIHSRQISPVLDLGEEYDARSAIAVPLLIGAEALGAIVFSHHQSQHFTSGQIDLIQAAANQIAVAVNNAELYRLIRDQAEDLGQMVRSQQVETQRTKEILEDVADGVLVTDDTMNITLFNDSAEKILDLSRERVLGKSLEHFTGLFGSTAQHWMDTIRTWSNNPGAYQQGDTYAEQITLDTERVVSVHLAPVTLKDNFLGTVSIFRDITHQVEVDMLKSEFVATVSHELRTPMTSIKGYVEILLMGAAGELNEQQTQFLQVVRQNSERLTILVNDLLDISRIESGNAVLALGPLNLAEVAELAIQDLRNRTVKDDKPMQIHLQMPPRLPPAYGDFERVRQILDNLLENAYYYTPENGQITLRMQSLGDEIQIHVQDNGIGIPPELQEQVFERFYRGEHPFVLASSGTGLGLAVVKNIVMMHGGRIWLESPGIPGEGSTFSFTLPLYIPNNQ